MTRMGTSSSGSRHLGAHVATALASDRAAPARLTPSAKPRSGCPKSPFSSAYVELRQGRSRHSAARSLLSCARVCARAFFVRLFPNCAEFRGNSDRSVGPAHRHVWKAPARRVSEARARLRSAGASQKREQRWRDTASAVLCTQWARDARGLPRRTLANAASGPPHRKAAQTHTALKLIPRC